MSADFVLERLKRLHPKAIDLSLERIERLLAALGHPERRLPPVVHVAGTNGKGSVIAFMRAMLEAEGRRVHVYTSPHLVRFAERIRLGGRLIEEGRLSEVLGACEAANGARPITFFEITTAAAFVAFAETPAEALLLETGLGGRLDATNLIERPRLTVITPVSLDHQHYLGPSLEAIAGEKAGILKPGVACVLGPQPREALAAITRRARAVGAPLVEWGHDYGAEAQGLSFVYRDGGERLELPRPALAGSHQLINAATALAAARRLLDLAPSPGALAQGLCRVRWPARLQAIPDGPLARRLPPGWELWLDGGHNGGAGEALAASFARWSDKPLDLVVGMIDSKDPEAFVGPLLPRARSLSFVPVPNEPAGFSPDDLAQRFGHLDRPLATAPDVGAALAQIVRAAAHLAAPPGRVLVTGSLYLAGAVLAESGMTPD